MRRRSSRFTAAPSLPVLTSTAMSAGRKRRKPPAGWHEARIAIIQQRDDALGAARGELPHVVVARRQRIVELECHCTARTLRGHERLGASGRLDGNERQRVAGGGGRCAGGVGAEHERALAGSRLRLREHMVHRIHQRGSGTMVGAEHVVAPVGVATRVQVAVDVGTAEGEDRLLRVADQEQRGLRIVVALTR